MLPLEVRVDCVSRSPIDEVHDLDGAARIGEAARAALGNAIRRNADAKMAFVVAAAARLGLALVGDVGVGKTQLVKQALPMIADLTADETLWVRASHAPAQLQATPERVQVRPGRIDVVPAAPSIFERDGAPSVLVLDMLDHFGNEPELHAFAASRSDAWRLRISPTTPVDRTRILISTWVHPAERGFEVPAAVRRLHHVAVHLSGPFDRDDEPWAPLDEPPISPAHPAVTWNALDGLDRVAQERVRLDAALWAEIGTTALDVLGSTRASISEHVARLLAALEGRSAVVREDLKRAARWAAMPEEL